MPILKHYLIHTPYSMWKTFLEKTCQKLHLHFFLQSLLTAIHMLVVSTSDGSVCLCSESYFFAFIVLSSLSSVNLSYLNYSKAVEVVLTYVDETTKK